jgi:lipid-A-disaccharide synthase-like uncharacterized protein
VVSNLAFWLTVGFLGQALFTARFLVQWLVSEARRASVVPVAFWWLSLLGGAALLSYAISRRDVVIITGQGMGLLVYVRNLMLVGKARRRAARCAARATRGSAAPASARQADLFVTMDPAIRTAPDPLTAPFRIETEPASCLQSLRPTR